MKKKRLGGRREGAGRRKTPAPAVKALRVSERTYEAVVAHANGEGCSLADAARDLIAAGVQALDQKDED